MNLLVACCFIPTSLCLTGKYFLLGLLSRNIRKLSCLADMVQLLENSSQHKMCQAVTVQNIDSEKKMVETK